MLQTKTMCQVSSLKAISFANPLRSSPREVLQTRIICQVNSLKEIPLQIPYEIHLEKRYKQRLFVKIDFKSNCRFFCFRNFRMISFVNPLRSSPREVLQTETICQVSSFKGDFLCKSLTQLT